MASFAPRFMDTVGDGSGSINLNVDGSVTPVIFRIAPAPGQILFLSRIIFFLEDAGSIDSGGFGNGAALTNGLDFRFRYDVGLPSEGSYPDPTFFPIKKNIDWAAYCYDVQTYTWGQGNEGLGARYTFARDVNGNDSQLPWLADSRKEEFQIVVRDNLSTIVDIKCRVGAYSK
jgi:hypothetical protein